MRWTLVPIAIAALWLGGFRPFGQEDPARVEIRIERDHPSGSRLAAQNHGARGIPDVEIFGYGRNGSVRLQRKEQWQPGETLELGPLVQWISPEGGWVEIRAEGRTLAEERF